jgi:DNA-directed RNA polymerase subunit RPC12/RpoP
MRLTALFSVLCPCGHPVEWDSADRETACPHCRRVLVVEAWPNTKLVTVVAEGRR